MQPLSFNSDVRDLLGNANLLFEDLDGNNNVRLFGEVSDKRLIGLVGIEGMGADMLLRSLVVSELARNQGLGRILVEYAERQASELGAESVYLLTTTEKAFFEKLGYQATSRVGAPDAITQTAQFSGLCPQSAHFLIKRLAM